MVEAMQGESGARPACLVVVKKTVKNAAKATGKLREMRLRTFILQRIPPWTKIRTTKQLTRCKGTCKCKSEKEVCNEKAVRKKTPINIVPRQSGERSMVQL